MTISHISYDYYHHSEKLFNTYKNHSDPSKRKNPLYFTYEGFFNFKSGLDETRTRDLLRDRQAF
jgi:hypothetical protein